jgi:hypothetical protein
MITIMLHISEKKLEQRDEGALKTKSDLFTVHRSNCINRKRE